MDAHPVQPAERCGGLPAVECRAGASRMRNDGSHSSGTDEQADGDGAARRGAADGKRQRGLDHAAYLRESADAVHLRDFAASVYLASDHRRVAAQVKAHPERV